MKYKGAHAGTIIMILLWLGGCSPQTHQPPSLRIDETVCARCRMLVSEPAYAAAYRIDARDEVFDDIGCLISALSEEEDRAGATVWVHDLEDREWLTAESASFVRLTQLGTPMGSGLVALRTPAAAAQLAEEYGGEVHQTFSSLFTELGGVASHGH